jgi:hypothetical protein
VYARSYMRVVREHYSSTHKQPDDQLIDNAEMSFSPVLIQQPQLVLYNPQFPTSLNEQTLSLPLAVSLDSPHTFTVQVFTPNNNHRSHSLPPLASGPLSGLRARQIPDPRVRTSPQEVQSCAADPIQLRLTARRFLLRPASCSSCSHHMKLYPTTAALSQRDAQERPAFPRPLPLAHVCHVRCRARPCQLGPRLLRCQPGSAQAIIQVPAPSI